MMRDRESGRCVHDVLRRIRNLPSRVLLARIVYVRGHELQAPKNLRAEVFGERSCKFLRVRKPVCTVPETRSSRS